MRFNKLSLAAGFASALVLAGCASVPPDAGTNPEDPWEKMNRQTFMMNTVLDEFMMRPIAKGYVNVVPEPVRTGVTNVFVNLGEPSNVVNNALQGKGEDTLASVFRFLINTTFGLGGVFDVAGTVGNQPERREDFGQTLQVWGVPRGPYFVIPFLGPSTVTDAAGDVVDCFGEPMTYVENDLVSWGSWGVYAVDLRARMLPATDLLRDSIDPYVMAREAYFSTRRNAVYDGNPPLELTPDEFEDEDEEAEAQTASEAASAEKAK